MDPCVAAYQLNFPIRDWYALKELLSDAVKRLATYSIFLFIFHGAYCEVSRVNYVVDEWEQCGDDHFMGGRLIPRYRDPVSVDLLADEGEELQNVVLHPPASQNALFVQDQHHDDVFWVESERRVGFSEKLEVGAIQWSVGFIRVYGRSFARFILTWASTTDHVNPIRVVTWSGRKKIPCHLSAPEVGFM